MSLLVWDDATMGMGIEEIDNQHKQLICIINDLAKAIDEEAENEFLFDIVNRLIEYTKYHFSTEEKYFDQFNFENSSLHKSEHKYFVEHFMGIQKGLEKGAKARDKSIIKLSQEMLDYLTGWFLTHIKGSDREYAELFKKNGL